MAQRNDDHELQEAVKDRLRVELSYVDLGTFIKTSNHFMTLDWDALAGKLAPAVVDLLKAERDAA